jgi:hypothetical protein
MDAPAYGRFVWVNPGRNAACIGSIVRMKDGRERLRLETGA